MTIRARLLLTQTVIGVVVVALCALAIDLARMASELSRMPARQMSALGHIHQLFDSVGQAVKELDDITFGEDDFDELTDQMARAHTALASIRSDARDALAFALLQHVDASLTSFERESIEVVAIVKAGDPARARILAFPIGETIYEHDFRPALDRVAAHAVANADAVQDEGTSRSRALRLLAIVLVLAGLIGTAIGTVIVVRIQRRLSALADTAAAIGADVAHARSHDVTARDELGDLGRSFNHMADDVAKLIETTAAKEALASELALAARMQQSLLPPTPRVAGLEIAGAMSAATQVGGDYYDVLPARDGAWIAIGDVSGHGFNTGVVTLLAQSAISSVTRSRPDARPSEILGIVNFVLHDLVRVRLGLRDHMTLTLLRYRNDGTVEFAGAHQEIIVRATDGTLRTIETPGPWLGIVPDIGPHLVDGRFQLAAGETIVLFTDGVVEARLAAGDMFGIDRLLAAMTELPHDAAPQAVRDAVLARVQATTPRLDDDATVLAIRRLAEPQVARFAS
jgi:serine phosphatase RsbU (regulator of sigma subunit)